ncbi:MAG: efflux RND transporter periplasmic adaptor subunit [Bacteroidota bacterium]|nr:efflux RND transporter periplasmic adaptor subunit [Bacteroidota bacterium]
MNKIFYISALTVFLMSCGATTDKRTELNKLKAERDRLNTQISQIESNINPNAGKNERKVTKVNVTDVTPSVFNHYIQVQGTVDGDENIAVSPQIAGIVTAVYVKEGSLVRKGNLLAELDTKVLKQSLEEVNIQLELATSIYEKQSALWKKNIGSEVQYLQTKTNKESLEQRIATLKEQLKQAKIFSPINGSVESVPLRVGQSVSPGAPNSTIRVINMRIAKISADVSEAYATHIRGGNTVLVNFPDVGKEFETKLSFTGRFIDPTNRTFKVECKISSGDVALRANMIAYIKIKDYSNQKAFCLPVNLVQNDRDGKFIYVAKRNGAKWVVDKRIIKTGKDYDGIIEVSDGLASGDKIISAGFQNLNPGENVIF